MARPLGSLALMLLLAAPALAQEHIEVFTVTDGAQTRMLDVDATVRGFGNVLAATPLTHVPTDFLNNATAVAGGRYVAWLAGSVNHPGQDLFLFDRRTRTVLTATSALPPAMPVGARYPSFFQVVGADSHRPRLFVTELRATPIGPSIPSHFVWTIDLTGKPPVELAALVLSSPRGVGYAADTDDVFINDAAVTADTRMLVVNATTGVEVRRFTHVLSSYGALTEPGGRVVWVNDGMGMRTLDARTGAVLATSPNFQVTSSTYDPARGVLVVRQGDFLVVVDPLRLTEIGRARVAFTPPSALLSESTDTLLGRWMTGAYVLRSSYRYGNITCNDISLDALDATGAKRATADLLARIGSGGNSFCLARGFLFRSPFAPTGLVSSVSGRTVQLFWKDPGDILEFELEFGFTPGQRAGAIRVGAATSLTIPGVPPGAYYVRVKALNEVGPSPASSDIRVVIP